MFFLLEMVRCYDALPDGLQTHQDTHLSGTRDKGRLMLGVGNNFSPALSKMHTSNHQMKSCVGFFCLNHVWPRCSILQYSLMLDVRLMLNSATYHSSL